MKPIEAVKVKKVLDRDEQLEYGIKAAELAEEIEGLELEKKAVVKEFTAKIDKLKVELDEAHKATKEGYVMVVFAGNRRKNFDQGVWEYIDPNTGRVVDTKPFGPEDLQMTTEDVDAKNKAKNYEDPEGKDVDLDALEAKINRNLGANDSEDSDSDEGGIVVEMASDVEDRDFEDASDLRTDAFDPDSEPVAVQYEDSASQLTEAAVLVETKPTKASTKKGKK